MTGGPRYLPGDRPPEDAVACMLRVDHAGEFGAERIYAGQLAVLGRGPSGDILRHMAEQEAEHKRTFDALLPRRRVRPTLLMPLWHVAGYALGYVTAKMGDKAAMACTVAVEDVIDALRNIAPVDVSTLDGIEESVHFRLPVELAGDTLGARKASSKVKERESR